MRKTLTSIVLAAAFVAVPAAFAAPPAHSAWDEQYLMTSISGDRFEVGGGKLAIAKGQTAAVKALGRRLVADHSKSLKESIALAHKLGIDVPKSATPSMQWELKVVSSFSGTDFDAWYASLEVMDHQQDITEAQDEWKDGTNAEVRASAKQEIPMLQAHLRLAKQAQKA
jgi:putative membrane protein